MLTCWHAAGGKVIGSGHEIWALETVPRAAILGVNTWLLGLCAYVFPVAAGFDLPIFSAVVFFVSSLCLRLSKLKPL
jgi:hypothetical protein